MNVKFQYNDLKKRVILLTPILGSRVSNALPIVDKIYADAMYSSLQE